MHRHIGRNLCRFPPFPQGKGACGKDAGKLFLPMESRGAALGHGDGHCRASKGGFGRNDSFHAGRGAFSKQYQQLHARSEILFLLVQRAGADPSEYPPVQGRGNGKGNLFRRGTDRASEKARHSQDNLCGISGLGNYQFPFELREPRRDG